MKLYPVRLSQLRLQVVNGCFVSTIFHLLFSFLSLSLPATFRLLPLVGVALLSLPSPAFASVWFGAVRREVASLLAIIARAGLRSAIGVGLGIGMGGVTSRCSPLLFPLLTPQSLSFQAFCLDFLIPSWCVPVLVGVTGSTVGTIVRRAGLGFGFWVLSLFVLSLPCFDMGGNQ